MARVLGLERLVISEYEKLIVATGNFRSKSATYAVAAIRHSEGKAREGTVMLENIRKNDGEAEKFLKLALTTSNFLSDSTLPGLRAKHNTAIIDLVNSYMNFVRDVPSQADSVLTGMLFCMNRLKNSDPV